MFLWFREGTNGHSSHTTSQWWTKTSSFEENHGLEVSHNDSLPIQIVTLLLQELNDWLSH